MTTPTLPEELRLSIAADIAAGDMTACSTVSVLLPGGDTPIHQTAAQLGHLLGQARTHFVRGGVVCRITADGAVSTVGGEALSSTFGQVAQLKQRKEMKGKVEDLPAVCSTGMAKQIMACEEFSRRLPQLNVIARCPVLVERGDKLVTITGYDLASGILAQGSPPEEMTAARAKELLCDLLRDFDFATEADRSRALAGLIEPALVQGGLLNGRTPIHMSEADQSQAGKGYRSKVIAAIYHDVVHVVNQSTGGVGSLSEQFDHQLIAGRSFISLDNIEGKFNSQKILSFCTEDNYLARVPYGGNMTIDPRRVYVMFTSNRAEFSSNDFPNRCSIVRIRKRPWDYKFHAWTEGGLLEHVRANQPLYLGAVFTIVKEWHKRGKPKSEFPRHDFREWAESLDWIVRKLLEGTPLMDGHREAQERTTRPDQQWLRDVVNAVVQAGRTAEKLSASDLIDVSDSGTNFKLPGLAAGEDIETDDVKGKVRQQIGRVLARIFGKDEDATVAIDGWTVRRIESTDSSGKTLKSYWFSTVDAGSVAGYVAPATGLASLPPSAPPPPPPLDLSDFDKALLDALAASE